MISPLKEDFNDFENDCLAVLLFGSATEGAQTARSDIDICIIKPVPEILDRIYARLGGKYDVKIFEALPLYVRIGIMEHFEVLYGDELELSEYPFIEKHMERNGTKDFWKCLREPRREIEVEEEMAQ
jgi:hypothetical protein